MDAPFGGMITRRGLAVICLDVRTKKAKRREIPHIGRPTASSRKTVRDAKGAQERRGKKKVGLLRSE